jgi:hypothetical protein
LTREQSMDLDDPYGGFNFGDEAAAFGDNALTTDYGPASSAEYDDPMTDDADVANARARDARRRYLMITWGNLRADTLIDFPTDWSGSLRVKNGFVVLKRTIRFDPRDEILPRTSRDTLEWISHTQPHFDGILVAIHRVPCDTAATSVGVADTTDRACIPEPIEVTFDTGPLTISFTQEELADLHEVIRVDDAGNAVAFNTIVVEPHPCPGGFLAGQWRNVDDRPGGVFRGKWISHNGVHMGYLRGFYGVNSRGHKVFFGKWVTEGGRFQGLLRGRYDRFGDRPGGWFAGEWVERDLRVHGALRGVWVAGDDPGGRGYFRGIWSRRCRL